jgi:putative tryptophan/tyrosine transport system substrate-binding protein
MRRRALIAALGAIALRPLAAASQQAARMRRVGVLMATRADDVQGTAYAAAFVQELAAHQWNDGRNLRIDWRWAGGDDALFDSSAAELVALDPEVLLAFTSAAVQALRRRTSTIPIVFTVVSDPIGQGLVESLGHPGGNVTGFSAYDPPMAAKWLQLLKQIAPSVVNVAALYNPSTAPFTGALLRAIETAAPSFAVAVRTAPVTNDAEIEATMAGLPREGGGLLVLQGAFTRAHRAAIIALAARYRLPAIYPYRSVAESGGLISYGIDNIDLFRRAAGYVDRILNGENPRDLPVQLPDKFELAINLQTAKALGLNVPQVLLSRADAVIE